MLTAFIGGFAYLFLCMPVTADLSVMGRGLRFGASLSLRAWWIVLHIERLLSVGRDRKRAGEHARRIYAKKKLICAALNAVRWGQTDVNIRLGTGDAAQTALLSGGIQACAQAIAAIAGRRFPLLVHTRPDYRRACFALDARCIFSFSPGDIILAVLAALLAAAGEKWKSGGNSDGKASDRKPDGHIDGEYPGNGGRQYCCG